LTYLENPATIRMTGFITYWSNIGQELRKPSA
jgi:hypothetical protein